MGYFYVLQSLSNTKWLYKGSTPHLQRRLMEHKAGNVQSSKPYLPLRLVYVESYTTLRAARERESSIKKNGNMWVPLRKRIIKHL